MEVRLELHVPAALTPENKAGSQLRRRVCGSVSRSGSSGEEKNLLHLQVFEPQTAEPVA